MGVSPLRHFSNRSDIAVTLFRRPQNHRAKLATLNNNQTLQEAKSPRVQLPARAVKTLLSKCRNLLEKCRPYLGFPVSGSAAGFPLVSSAGSIQAAIRLDGMACLGE
jgi:hypothetical protein